MSRLQLNRLPPKIRDTRHMLRLFFLVGIVLQFSISAQAMEIAYSNLNPFNGARTSAEGLFLKGEIVPGDYNRLLKVIKTNSERFWRATGVVLASPGGDVQEALKIARFVKGTYRSVFVGENAGPCASACFFIYAAAPRREAASNLLGIHRPFISPSRLQSMYPQQAETTQNNILREARAYLENLNVPTNLVDKMFQRASTEIHWLTREEVAEQLGLRPPWYEQFLIAKCGLNKKIEQDYYQTADDTLLVKMLEVDRCGFRLSKADAEIFLNTELNQLRLH